VAAETGVSSPWRGLSGTRRAWAQAPGHSPWSRDPPSSRATPAWPSP